MNTAPDSILDLEDTGDETLKRYRYQITYSAIVGLSLLDGHFHEIYCEHFEDLLIKLKNKKFVGIQVKTRSLELPPFAFDDVDIVKSISKFTLHELTFPRHFERYSIVSNHGFFNKTKNLKSLHYVIELAKENNRKELLKSRSTSNRIIKDISKKLKCSVDIVIDVLAKTHLKGDFCSLQEIKSRLVHKLNEIPKLKGQTLTVLTQMANRLIVKFFELSSLQGLPQTMETYLGLEDPDIEEVKNIIQSKKISKEELTRLIDEATQTPITLVPEAAKDINALLRGSKRLEIKMDKGGIDYDNVLLHKDYKFSVETHLLEWIHKYGPEEANKLYNQIRLVVQSECQEAYDENKLSGTFPFGINMLVDVKKRLRSRSQRDKKLFRDMQPEHLFGMTALLTEECRIWWSDKFDIE